MAMTSLAAGAVIDVRDIEPRLRHPVIFGVFGRLSRGESFEIVNDHDPKPLLHRFGLDYPGAFDWTYREEGPDVWRVRIGRI
jgi:uncharacterized protein (DUF2249 family)